MSYPTYTRIPSSAYPQAGARNAYEAGQSSLAAQKAWEAQQKAAGQNTYANRVELEKELAANESEIRKLQAELGSMQDRWKDLDSMDRELAANRARIGDFGNARAHQNDIINRRNDRKRAAETRMQWRWQAEQNRIGREADQKKQAQADIRRIIGEIEDIDTQIPYHTEIGAQNALKAKRNRLVSELASYGVSDPVETQSGNQVQTQGPDSVATLVQNEAASTNNKGLFNSADEREKIAKAYEGLGLKAEAKRVRNTKTVSEVNSAKANREAEKRDADAIAARYFGNIDIDFKRRWNAASPDAEIKKLKKFYRLENGLLVSKGG